MANLLTDNLYFMKIFLKRSYEENQKCCTLWNSITKTNLISRNHIFIKKVFRHARDYKISYLDGTVILKDNPKKIDLFHKTFILRGLINFIPLKNKCIDKI